MPCGTLYLVATPIGNLEDITLRALRVLKEVSLIACEDTRQTRKLLNHHAIRASLAPCHRFNEKRALPGLLGRLSRGEDLALVTDGGTPSISDPGFSLVRAAREAGIPVVPVPGPCAAVAALVGSALPADRFSFFGFLPHRSGERRRLLETLRDRPETLIFFDSPRRVPGSLKDMAEILGERSGVVCREMTKLNEEFRRGSLADLARQLEEAPVLGEVTLVVEGAPPPGMRPADPGTLRSEVEQEILEKGVTRRDAMRAVARRRGIPRREVYRALRDPRSGPGRPGSGEPG